MKPRQNIFTQERPRVGTGQQGSGQLSVSLGMSHSVSHSSYNSANEVSTQHWLPGISSLVMMWCAGAGV